jgi:hypothetical protein
LTGPTDAWDAARRVVASLEASGLPYAIGGAMAYGLWAIPRATNDVDVDVFIDSEIEALLAALHGAGVAFDDDAAHRGHADGGFFVGWLDQYRVDVFTPSIPFSWEAGRTRVRARMDDLEGWFLSAEATALFKLLFFRGKDIVDLERLVATCVTLDHAYIRRWIVDMMGEDDPRTLTWDDLVARLGRRV